jgi:hypothetical protein
VTPALTIGPTFAAYRMISIPSSDTVMPLPDVTDHTLVSIVVPVK